MHTENSKPPEFVWQGDGDAGFVKNNKLYSFSTIVFTSWDFHLTDWEAARNLRISIRTQLKEMLNDATDVRPTEYAEIKAALPKVRLLPPLRLVQENLLLDH